MVQRRTGLFKNALLLIDVGISMQAFVCTFLGRELLARATQDVEQLPDWAKPLALPLVTDLGPYYVLFLSMPILFGLAFYLSGTNDHRASYRQLALRYVRAIAIGVAGFVTVGFLFRLQPTVARSFIALYGVVAVPMLLLTRYAVIELAAFLRHKRIDGHRVVVVGCSADAVRMARALDTQPMWHLKLVGHVCVPGEFCDNRAVPRLGEIDRLADLLDHTPVDEVVFATSSLASEALAGALSACDERGVDVLLPLPPTVPSRARVEVAAIDGYDAPLLGLRRTPTGEARLAMKRLMDIVGAGIVLLAATPVMLVVAVLIKLTSPGPVLFKQIRAGKHGRKFWMYKFRSMVPDAEARRAELMHLNEMDGPVFKIKKDPRVTLIGGIIRKTSLDELPQLFNIIKGDMSLVGPRPPLPSEVEQYKPWQRRRLSVRPGLTGLWQVSGRNNVDFEEWMALDLRYIDDWSLWLDAKILLRTVPAVLLKTGAS